MKTLNYRPNLLLFNGRINIYIRALLLTLWRPSPTLELGRHNVKKVHVCKYLFCHWIIASLGDNLMFSSREKISTTQTPMTETRYMSAKYIKNIRLISNTNNTNKGRLLRSTVRRFRIFNPLYVILKEFKQWIGLNIVPKRHKT